MVFRFIFLLCFILLASCSADDAALENSAVSVDPTITNEFDGIWGRSFTIMSETNETVCIREIVEVSELKWKLIQLHYNDLACSNFKLQHTLIGGITSKKYMANKEGLPVTEFLLENIDWLGGASKPLLDPKDDALMSIMNAITGAILWGKDSKIAQKTFGFDIYSNNDSFFSNTYNLFLIMDIGAKDDRSVTELTDLLDQGKGINQLSAYKPLTAVDIENLNTLSP